MATTADVQAIITATESRVEKLSSRVDSLARDAMSAAQSYRWGASNYPRVNKPALRDAPPAYQGNIDVSVEMQQAYASALSAYRPEFKNGLAAYLAEWFPDCMMSTTNNWICDTILYGETGLPANIEEALWERARSREVRDADRLTQEAFTQLSVRNFTIPPGAMAARILGIQQGVSDKSSTLSRDITIKHIDLIIENVKFAVTEGTKIRLSVMSGINGYMKAHLMPEELAIEKAKAIATAKLQLMGGAAAYYNAMISEADLQIKAETINAGSWDSASSINSQEFVSGRSLMATVAQSLAQSYGQTAAAAASGIIGVAQSSISAQAA